MIRSLFSGVSGLKTHQQKMDVIGNNISNVNTVGFKSSTVNFKDVYYQTSRSATAGTATRGGINPTQIGYGTQLSSVTPVMTRSGFNFSDSIYDLAIAGEGFFQVMDQAGNLMYTRNGSFQPDSEGYLTDTAGNRVLGVMGNFTGIDPSSNPIQLLVPSVTDNVSSATRVINGTEVTISTSIPTSQGDITIKFTDGKSPFATFSGNVLEITFDMSKQYTTQNEFQQAIDAAISAGGVTLPRDMSLNIDFGLVPTNVNPTTAQNSLSWEFNQSTDPTTPDMQTASVGFIAGGEGSYANNYQISFSYVGGANRTTASWDGSVLTLTIGDDTDLTAINDAIVKAAGSDVNKIITCTDFSVPTTPEGLKAAFGGNPRLRLSGGTDSFYTEVANLLSTFKLEGGRVAESQTHAELSSVTVGSDGTIIGVHPVHGFIELGRIDIVTFENPGGLSAIGNSYFMETPASGGAKLVIAGLDGSGEIVSGALEMSNVDLSQEFADMIITQRGFQANSRVITTSDTILEELVNLKR